jgi:hypothetical protein
VPLFLEVGSRQRPAGWRIGAVSHVDGVHSSDGPLNEAVDPQEVVLEVSGVAMRRYGQSVLEKPL